ncbi:MAG: hypothetical protein ACTHMI_24135 [Mucilaginibacter sp.]
MQTYLDQPEATFYHICALEDLANITEQGIKGKNAEIFVSRVGEMPVLAAIAVEQLANLYDADGLVVLKLPQALNNFTVSEIFEDYRAPIERTGLFQNIIRRSHIPVGCFEIMMKIEFGTRRQVIFDLLNALAAQANINYPHHAIYKRAQQLQINKY